MQRLSKHIVKAFAVIAMLAVAFGPFAPLAQTVAAATPIDANTPGATYIPGTVNGGGVVIQPSTGTATNATTGQTKTGPAQKSSCSTITDCLANMVYYIGPGFASWVASWSAYFFDFIVRISLQSPAYSLTFLADSWNLVLSLANMFFIFILIYAAFVIMLRAETARTLQTLAWVIAIALVVNFSFFFTRVVIDAGNILGTQFYNAVAVQSPNLNAGSTSAPATPDITQPMMQALGLEQLLGGSTFSLISGQLDSGSWGALLVLTVIYIFAAIMFWVLAVALLMVGLKFFLRVVGLWLVLVASPLAFVAQTLSNTRKFFDMWLRTLVSFSMYPAVFLFMFWVLDKFVVQLAGGTGGLQNVLLNNAALSANAAAGTANAAANQYPLLVLIANISIRMMFVIVMLYIMLKVSDWVIEQAGGMASSFINRGSAAILGGGFRTAAWAGAFAGRNTAGRAAYGAAQNGSLRTWAATSRIGNTLLRSTTALSRSTFDARNAPGASVIGSRLGTLSRTSDVNTGRASQRTFAQAVADKSKRIQAEADNLKATSGEAWREQQNVIEEHEKKFGKGSYTNRVSDLQKRVNDFNTTAQQAKQEAILDPGMAIKLKAVAKFNEDAAKRTSAELKNLTGLGQGIAETNAKARIAAFADRIDKRNEEPVFNPSWGAIAGADAVRGASKGAAVDSTQSAQQHAERSTENREIVKAQREMTQTLKEMQHTIVESNARSAEKVAETIAHSNRHLGDKISELKHVTTPNHTPPASPAAPAAHKPAVEHTDDGTADALSKAA